MKGNVKNKLLLSRLLKPFFLSASPSPGTGGLPRGCSFQQQHMLAVTASPHGFLMLIGTPAAVCVRTVNHRLSRKTMSPLL